MPKINRKSGEYVRPDFDAMSDDELRIFVETGLEKRREIYVAQGRGEAEIEMRISKARESGFCMARQISVCCHAPWDKSRVIPSGRFAGHGSYYCSKCGNSLFHS